jgi:hypothetical protein
MIVGLRGRKRVAISIGVGLASLMLMDLLFIKKYYSTPRKQQLRETCACVVDFAREHPERDFVLVGWAHDVHHFDYYFDKLGSERRIELLVGTKQDLPSLRALLAQRGKDYVWFVSGPRPVEDGFIDSLMREMTLVETRTFLKANAYLFKVSPESTGAKTHG